MAAAQRQKGLLPSRTFATEWREPKLVTIFVHDEQGRMVKGSLPTIDTFLGPDAIAELVAMHLVRLGAATAQRADRRFGETRSRATHAPLSPVPYAASQWTVATRDRGTDETRAA